MIDPWKKVASTPLGEYVVFDVREDRRRSPVTGTTHAFYVIEAPDWCNILPITPEGQVVCVWQYRFGTEAPSLEIPGGIIDPEDGDPLAAAQRELLEETGYAAEQLLALGSTAPNPALQNNRCHHFLALGARWQQAQVLEATEDLAVELVDLADIPARMTSGEIHHALVYAAFLQFEHHRRAHPDLTFA